MIYISIDIERFNRYKVTMSLHQINLPKIKRLKTIFSVLGICIGGILGMVPLLIKYLKKEKMDEKTMLKSDH